MCSQVAARRVTAGGEHGVAGADRGGLPGVERTPERSRRVVRPHAAAGRPGRAERARRHDAVQGRHRRRGRGGPRRGLLPAGARDHLRGGPRPVRPGRAGRRGHGRGRADQARRPDPDRRHGVPAHADLRRADGGQRRLLRADRPRAGGAAPAGRGRHPDRPAGVRRGRWRRRRPGQRGPVRGLRGHRAADVRGLPADRRDHREHGRRDRGGRPSRRHDGRRANGFRRSGPVDPRSAPRPDDRPGGPTGDREVARWGWTSRGRRRSSTG